MNRPVIQRSCWWVLLGVIAATLAAQEHPARCIGEEDLLFLAWPVYAPVGALVAYRRPDDAIGWVLLFVGLLASLTALSLTLLERAQDNGLPYGSSVAVPALSGMALMFPLILLSTTVTFLLYPSGLPSTRWRPVLWFTWTLVGLSFVIAVMNPTIGVEVPGGAGAEVDVENPFWPGFLGRLVSSNPDTPHPKPLDFTFPAFLVLMVLCTAVAIWSAIRRTWLSSGIERLQMRLFAAAIALLILTLWPAQYLAEHGHSTGRYLVLAAAFALIPISCGVAILRYRLYEIDRIIGRTTAYAMVTGVLLAVYGVVVTSVGQLLPESSDLAVAAATLSVAALFRPVLGWARRVVARRFDREQYDAEREVDAFAVRLRSEVDVAEVRHDLLAVLDRTVQPASSGLWVSRSRR